MSAPSDHEQFAGLELEAEFENEPVPPHRRKSLHTVAAVWFGFPLILTCAVFGGILSALLGFRQALLTIVVGNLILFAYVGTLSYFAGRSGRNFALQARQVFGRVGYLIVAAFLAAAVIGWFAFNTGLTGATIEAAFGWTEWAVTFVASIIYVALTFIGVRALSVIGLIAAPLFVVVAIIALVVTTDGVTLSGIWNYEGVTSGAAAFSIGAGITLVIATFADSGTMTADFTRWAKNGRQAILAASSAFPIANFVAFLAGAVTVATGIIPNPTVNGGNFVLLFSEGGWVLSILAFLFVFVSLGSVSTHCLYNGAVSWSNLFRTRMRVMCLILGLIGTVAATAGIWNYFLDWLNFLAVFVPPIGAVIVTSEIMRARSQAPVTEEPPVRPIAFASYACGAVAAGLVHYLAPQASEAVVGIGAAAASYIAFAAVAPRRRVATATIELEPH